MAYWKLNISIYMTCMQNIGLIIMGNQLFPFQHIPKTPGIEIFMMEDWELCTYEKHHKQKLIFFLTAMRNYRDELKESEYKITYHELATHSKSENFFTNLEKFCQTKNISSLYYFDITDKPFRKKFDDFLAKSPISSRQLANPMFIFNQTEFQDYSGGKIYQMGSFYKRVRAKKRLLMDGKDPAGGKWTYDEENRKKIPIHMEIPKFTLFNQTKHHVTVSKLVTENFYCHPGKIDKFWLPTKRSDAKVFFSEFLNMRFKNFGDYEDAIDTRGHFLFHSGISALLNIGLLLPEEVIDETLAYAKTAEIKLNNVEGFIRQIIGWREFIKGTYEIHGEEQETSNFFNHEKKLSDSWYTASTGIPPLDEAISGALDYGYTHHINRLMVISNIMNLCEVHPKEIYKWFMEMFVDSSEWVMVPNVYGMSTFADGGIFATKPYICGSNYILKMSNFDRGEWCEIVDGLYWRFIEKHSDFLKKNYRLSFMTRALNKISSERKTRIFGKANDFINEHVV